MNYKGIIIEESLQDTSFLKNVSILETKVEPVTPEHQTPWLSQWRLHTVEIPEKKADEIASEISRSFDLEHPDWYADFKNDSYHFIIFSNKIFKVDLANPVLYKQAKEYGLSINIPEHQVDFAPEDKIWER